MTEWWFLHGKLPNKSSEIWNIPVRFGFISYANRERSILLSELYYCQRVGFARPAEKIPQEISEFKCQRVGFARPAEKIPQEISEFKEYSKRI